MAIQMRRGNAINFDPSKLKAGEFAVSQDNQKIYLCITQGNVVEIATGSNLDQWIVESEAWAVGEKNGVPVDPTDETYHNNSKYYSSLAEESSLNPPYIGQNGNWWVYSVEDEEYVDSGVDASISVNIADVTMLATGATPYVTNTGTSTDPIFHLFIPAAKGVVSIAKTSTSGLNDTYTITYSDNTTSTFTVTNGEDGEDGRSITSITLSSRTGLVDTYTISYSDSTTSTFTVRNGNQWFNGTGVSGKSVTPTVFPSSGVSYAHEQDCYLNTTEGAVYVCVTGGIASVAEWTYKFTMSGGGSSGDMLASVYDPNSAVANAGGIPNYTSKVSGELVEDTVGWTGKNLLVYPYYEESKTQNGITFTVNNDGSITVSGTATADTWFNAAQNPTYITQGSSYILSGCPSGGSSNTYCLRYTNNTDKAYEDTGNGVDVVGFSSAYNNVQVHIRIKSGVVISTPITFYPMLRKASIADSTYEPYHDTVDQCKFDRAEQRVLGAKNFFNTNDIAVGADLITIDGSSIKIKNTTAAAWQNGGFRMPVEPNTDYIFSTDVIYTSGAGTISIRDKTGSGYTVLATYGPVQENEKVSISFNSQNNSSIVIVLFSTLSTSATGEVDYDYPMLRLASDPDDTYVPYAMTNRQLTESKDSWTDIATVDSSGHVTFTGLNDSYSYSNPFLNDNVARVITVARSGSGTNVTLIFALDGATQGDQCKLRIFR